jgi:RimJ/RimL family protein N-acetyltransferase
MLPDAFHTARLTLRPIAPDDADPIFDAYAQDPEVTRYLVWRPHRSRDETAAYVARSMAAAAAEYARTYVLLGRGDGRLRGAFDLRRPAPHRLEFGYVLARQWWGQGLMTEALAEIVRWGLAEPGVFRVGSVCDAANLASARVMEKAGLEREALLRRWSVHPNLGDEPRDCLSLARVR